MAALAAGAVVLVQFPFSDLSHAKLRPAVVVTDAGRGDWLLCQITSNPYGDSGALTLGAAEFKSGSLRTTSYARPLKLFTASDTIIVSQVGALTDAALRQITEAIVNAIQPRS